MDNRKKLCLVICTMNRPYDLYVTLRSILSNIILPDRIVVIDSSDEDLRNVVADHINRVKDYIIRNNLGVRLICIFKKGLSLTQARNASLEYVRDCDIIGFMDDDIIVHKRYLKEIMDVFEKYKDIYGVQGIILNATAYGRKLSGLRRFIETLLALFPASSTSIFYPKVNLLLRNKYPLYPYKKHILKSQWLTGCNMFYRSDVFFIYRFRFDEKLSGYSLGEDMDFSYRLYRNGLSMVMVTNAYLIHRPFEYFKIFLNRKTRRGGNVKLSVKIMDFGYRLYFFRKIYRSKMLALLLFLTYFPMVLIYNAIRRNKLSLVMSFNAFRIVFRIRKYIVNLDLKLVNDLINLLLTRYRI